MFKTVSNVHKWNTVPEADTCLFFTSVNAVTVFFKVRNFIKLDLHHYNLP